MPIPFTLEAYTDLTSLDETMNPLQRNSIINILRLYYVSMLDPKVGHHWIKERSFLKIFIHKKGVSKIINKDKLNWPIFHESWILFEQPTTVICRMYWNWISFQWSNIGNIPLWPPFMVKPLQTGNYTFYIRWYSMLQQTVSLTVNKTKDLTVNRLWNLATCQAKWYSWPCKKPTSALQPDVNDIYRRSTSIPFHYFRNPNK